MKATADAGGEKEGGASGLEDRQHVVAEMSEGAVGRVDGRHAKNICLSAQLMEVVIERGSVLGEILGEGDVFEMESEGKREEREISRGWMHYIREWLVGVILTRFQQEQRLFDKMVMRARVFSREKSDLERVVVDIVRGMRRELRGCLSQFYQVSFDGIYGRKVLKEEIL